MSNLIILLDELVHLQISRFSYLNKTSKITYYTIQVYLQAIKPKAKII